MSLFKLVGLECMKLKRTLALVLTFVAPATVVLLEFLMISQRGEHLIGEGINPWVVFFQQNMVFWSLLMMPLFVTLETALLAGLEEQEGHWQHLLVQPVARWRICAAKSLTAGGLFALSLLMLFGLMIAFGGLLGIVRPDLAFASSPIPWSSALGFLGLSLLAAWLLIALHQWVALRWRGFVLPLGFGMVMTVAGMLIMNSEWRNFYPWAMPGVVVNGFIEGTIDWRSVAFGAFGGMIVSVLSIADLARGEPRL